MKTLLMSALFALVAAAPSVQAATTEELVQKAEGAFKERDYNSPGIAKANEAAGIYGQVVAAQTDAKAQAKYLAKQAEALYFVGHANTDRDLKIKYHLAGMESADKGVKVFGITDVTDVEPKQIAELKKSLTAEELNLLGELLYQRGANLGQWGAANGVTASLGRWSELRETMNLIIKLGVQTTREYGALRTLGRGYHQIPGLLGGDNGKAEKYLQTAVEKTKAPGAIYSTNGYNNVYYAEVLRDTDKEQQGRELLEAFLKADPNTLNKDAVPETKKAQSEAAELLKDW
jgi:hypothetical protein